MLKLKSKCVVCDKEFDTAIADVAGDTALVEVSVNYGDGEPECFSAEVCEYCADAYCSKMLDSARSAMLDAVRRGKVF